MLRTLLRGQRSGCDRVHAGARGSQWPAHDEHAHQLGDGAMATDGRLATMVACQAESLVRESGVCRKFLPWLVDKRAAGRYVHPLRWC